MTGYARIIQAATEQLRAALGYPVDSLDAGIGALAREREQQRSRAEAAEMKVKELEAEAENKAQEYQRYVLTTIAQRDDLQSRLAQAERERDDVREAMRPFAKADLLYPDDWKDDDVADFQAFRSGTFPRIGAFRCAKSAIDKLDAAGIAKKMMEGK